MKKVFTAIMFIATSTNSFAEVPIIEKPNGDLEIKVISIPRKNVSEIERDMPGDQGKCVRYQILYYQDNEMSNSVMRIKSGKIEVEFEPFGDGLVRYVCGIFSEEYFDINGKLEYSMVYEEIEGLKE